MKTLILVFALAACFNSAAAQSQDALEVIDDLFGGVSLKAREYSANRQLQLDPDRFNTITPGNPIIANMAEAPYIRLDQRQAQAPNAITVSFWFQDGRVSQRRLNIELERSNSNRNRLKNVFNMVSSCSEEGHINGGSSEPEMVIGYFSNCNTSGQPAEGAHPFASLLYGTYGTGMTPISGWTSIIVYDNKIR